MPDNVPPYNAPAPARLAPRVLVVAFWVAAVACAAGQCLAFARMTVREQSDARQERVQQSLLDVRALAVTAAVAADGDPGRLRAAFDRLHADAPEAAAPLTALAAAAAAEMERPGRDGPATAALRAALAEVDRERSAALVGLASDEQSDARSATAAFAAATAAELLLLAVASAAVVRRAAHQRRLQAAIERARDAAEAAHAARAGVLHAVSHDLRTPLSAARLWAGALARRAADDPVAKEAAAGIERSLADQARLIDDLMDAARLDRGTMTLDVARVDLAAVVADACEAVRPAAEAKKVGLVLDVPAGGLAADADAFRVRQVVWNLAGNAVRFTPAGGRVTVSLRRDGASAATLAVADTGAGIAADLLPRVFDAFYQGRRGGRGGSGGLGLGLAIVREVAALHGGSAAAASDGPGRGATFTVTLPAAAAAGETGRH